MLNHNKNQRSKLFVVCILFFILTFAAACSSPGAEAADTEEPHNDHENGEEHEHDDNHKEDESGEHNEDDHAHGEGRIPNENGAAIHILSPTDGTVFKSSEQLLVEVAVENFNLGDEGNHWHIYIDGSSWGMVTGQNTDHALSGLEPGKHEIAVYMSIQTHEEYETGDSVQIVIEE